MVKIQPLKRLNFPVQFCKQCKLVQNLNFLITASNHDTGGNEINLKIKKFVKLNKNTKFIHNLGRDLYYQAMNECEFMIGNSSSGIIESMIYKKPSINILPVYQIRCQKG